MLGLNKQAMINECDGMDICSVRREDDVLREALQDQVAGQRMRG